MICKNDLPIRVFTLDTGRMFNETYHVWNRTLDRYKKTIEVYSPQAADVEKLMDEKRPYSFYESIENRKECCGIRKIEPFNRVFQDKQCQTTVIHGEHSANQTHTQKPSRILCTKQIKFHPLFTIKTKQ